MLLAGGWNGSRKRLPALKQQRAKRTKVRQRSFAILWALLLSLAFYYSALVLFFTRSSPPTESTQEDNLRSKRTAVASASNQNEASANVEGTCPFRSYPPHRYYHKDRLPLPDFLVKTEYIFGEWPALLETLWSSAAGGSASRKLCVNQSEWYHQDEEGGRLPFADGTNPSILRLKDNPRLDPGVANHFSPQAHFLATICMTNSQCAWKDTPREAVEHAISTRTEPSTVRTILLVLDEAFRVLEETTISTLIDAPFGRRIKPKPAQIQHQDFRRQTFALDDARLFTHGQHLWISYREGKHFGYDKQVLHPLHLDRADRLTATLRASEVETLCCGRNMALLDNVVTGSLEAVTWVDPLTVVVQKSLNRSEVEQQNNEAKNNNNPKKKEEKKKSDFHGTNGFMVHLPGTNEYLGIGHFHRPPGRETNDYARFGHHYTHAFFTIPDQPPYRLQRLSPELLLPSSSGEHKDAEIIQFWSGLDWKRTTDDGSRGILTMTYGINDCEGAAVDVDLATIENLLREVPVGKEVVDMLQAPLAPPAVRSI